MPGPFSLAGLLFMLMGLALTTVAKAGETDDSGLVIDDRGSGVLRASIGDEWRLVTDRVMGGRSWGELLPDRHLGRDCLRLRGVVSTANNGGFVQMTLDLAGGSSFDASDYAGVLLEVAGNGEGYNLHLRTSDLRLPWQSYRAGFVASSEWRRVRIPFSAFDAYRTGSSLRPSRLKRIGVVAIGREFKADLCLGELRLYREVGGSPN